MGRVLDGVAEHMSEYSNDRTFLLADAPEPDRAAVVEATPGWEVGAAVQKTETGTRPLARVVSR